MGTTSRHCCYMFRVAMHYALYMWYDFHKYVINTLSELLNNTILKNKVMLKNNLLFI